MTTRPRADIARDRTAIVAGILAAALYLATLFPGVGGLVNHGDSAKFQFLGVVPGIGHPPGNPLYLAVLAVVQRIPFGTAAMRANAASAILMALAVGFVAEASRLVANRAGAWVAAFAFTVGGLSWTFGTEAEVYALAAAFVAAIVAFLVRAEAERDRRSLALALSAYALGLSNHLSLAMAGPAILVAWIRLHRRGIRLSAAGWLGLFGAGSATLLAYGLLPWASTLGLPYSEFRGPPTFESLVAFVSAEQFRGSLAIPSLDAAVTERPLAVASAIAKQWMLALWLLPPVGLASLARRMPVVASFVGLAVLGWGAFAFAYTIPDADGFYLPICVACAPLLAVAVTSARHVVATSLLVLGLLVPTIVLRVRTIRDEVPFDVLEDVGYGVDPELLDLPDLVARIPRGALLAVPCSHYGCGEVTNYYRFADERTRAKHIEIVTILGGAPHGTPSPPRAIRPETARERVVCTISPAEKALLESHGARTRTLDRGHRVVRGVEMQRVPVFCSE